MFSVTTRGSFDRIEKFLKRVISGEIYQILEPYAQQGVAALRSYTPNETGLTANSWSYDITKGKGSHTIWWSNSHVNNGVNIAVILQYGHGTRNGGYVHGIDYINPALRKVLQDIADSAWEEVTK